MSDVPITDGIATRYWHRLDNGKIQCDLCPRYCKLHEGQRGLCFVRGALNGEIVLTSYGRSSGFCIDPVEKKPLNHFLPGSAVLSFGTAGCNLACKFCQNWDISKSRQTDTLCGQAQPEQLAAAAANNKCQSIAYTYNDPVIFMEYAVDTALACKELGINSIAVTAGYIDNAARQDFFSPMDAVNMDFKGFTESFYQKICGASLQAIQETLIYLAHKRDTWLEMTTLLIPGHNDSESELHEMAAWTAENLGPDIPWHFSAFHPDWKMPDVPATPLETLQRARRIAMQYGIRYVYTGNVHDVEGDTSYCHGCGEALIVRDWYEILDWNLGSGGHCNHCDAKIPGVFDNEPGNWGRKREVVRIRAAQ